MSVSPSDAEDSSAEAVSEETAVADVSHENQTDGVKSADSSTADEGGKEPSLLDAVTKVIDGDESSEDDGETSPSSDEDQGDGTDKAASDEEELPDEVSEEELAAQKPRTRKRMEQLLQKQKEKDEEVERLRPAAESYERIAKFAQDNQIDEQTVNNMLQYPVLRKQNPEMALQMIEREYAALRQQTGKAMPQDLRQQVEQGYITREHAEELSQARAREQRQKQSAEEQRKAEETRQQQQYQTALKETQQALSSVEQQWQQSDPDYAAKRDVVIDAFKGQLSDFQRQNNRLPTGEEATKLATSAKERVEKHFSKWRPQKQPVRPVSGGTASSEAKPKPKSMFDVVDNVLG